MTTDPHMPGLGKHALILALCADSQDAATTAPAAAATQLHVCICTVVQVYKLPITTQPVLLSQQHEQIMITLLSPTTLAAATAVPTPAQPAQTAQGTASHTVHLSYTGAVLRLYTSHWYWQYQYSTSSTVLWLQVPVQPCILLTA
jgi:hypothetical protein